MKNNAAIVIGLGAGILALIFLTRKAEAAEEIMASMTVAKLDAYYNIINELLITKEISLSTYTSLYNAYFTRFNELTGAA